MFADKDNPKGIPGKMKLQSVLPITLCLFIMTACSGKKVEPANDGTLAHSSAVSMAQEDMDTDKEENKKHADIYKRFLKNKEKVLIDCSGDVDNLFSFKKCEGRELIFSDIINYIVNYYYTVDESDVNLGNVEYAYLDCGKDGNEEIAISVGVHGSYDREVYLIIGEVDGKLRTVYSNLKFFEKKICINEYGYILNMDRPFWKKVRKEYVDGRGDYHYIATEKRVSDKLQYENIIIRSVERKKEIEKERFSFSKTEIYPRRYVLESADLNNTKYDEKDDICCGKLIGDISFPKYVKKLPYVCSVSEDAVNSNIIKDKRGINEYAQSLGLKLCSHEDYVKMLRAKEKESGLTDEIKNGNELKWIRIDCASFPINIRSIAADGDYMAYDELIRLVNRFMGDELYIEDVYYKGKLEFEDLTGLSYVLGRELFSDSHTVGYCRKDMDGNGVDELLVGSFDNDISNLGEDNLSPFDCVIYDMFTIRKGRLDHVFCGGERHRYYMCENGAIANEGSCSASESYWDFYRYHDGEMEFIEGLCTKPDIDCEGHIYYRCGDEESEVTDPDVYLGSFDYLDFAKYKYRKIDYTPIIEKVE